MCAGNATCNAQTQQCLSDYGYTSTGNVATDGTNVWSGYQIYLPSDVFALKVGIVVSAANSAVFHMALYSGPMGYITDTGSFTLVNGANEITLPFQPMLGAGYYWIMAAHESGAAPSLYQSSTTGTCVASTATALNNPFPASGPATSCTPWAVYLVAAQYP